MSMSARSAELRSPERSWRSTTSRSVPTSPARDDSERRRRSKGMGEQPLRAVIVPRVSTAIQAIEGTSLDGQELDCLRKATDIKATVHAIYRDEGVSGAAYLTRKGIQQALADIESGAANVLITAKIDRAGRDVDVLRDIKRRVKEAGAMLVFADGLNFENNATGNLMFNQMA